MVPFSELPRERTLVQRNVGAIVGIFALDRLTPGDRATASSIPIDGVAFVAVAEGGELSELSFSAWTHGLQMFVEQGMPASNRVDFTLSQLARRQWGPTLSRSASKRRKLENALWALPRTTVDVYNADPYTWRPSPGSQWTMNLLEGVGAHADVERYLQLARSDDASARARGLAALAARRSSGGDPAATWSMVLPMWLAESARQGATVILDWETQRRLRGSAQRIWVQLESYPLWVAHHVEAHDLNVPPDVIASLPTSTLPDSYIVPAADDPFVEVRTIRMVLDNDAYEAFGITHANRKRDLTAALRSIVSTDPTYLYADVVRPKGKRYFELRIARADGDFRQRILRRRDHDNTLGASHQLSEGARKS